MFSKCNETRCGQADKKQNHNGALHGISVRRSFCVKFGRGHKKCTLDTEATHDMMIIGIGGMTMGDRVLIVEEEARLREILCDYFSAKGE